MSAIIHEERRSAFDAVSSPARRALLQALLDSEREGSGRLTVSELALRTGIPRSQVSRHLAVLRDAGAVSGESVGTSHYHRIERAAIEAIEDWIVQFFDA